MWSKSTCAWFRGGAKANSRGRSIGVTDRWHCMDRFRWPDSSWTTSFSNTWVSLVAVCWSHESYPWLPHFPFPCPISLQLLDSKHHASSRPPSTMAKANSCGRSTRGTNVEQKHMCMVSRWSKSKFTRAIHRGHWRMTLYGSLSLARL